MQALQEKLHQQELDLVKFKLEQMKEKFAAAQALNFNIATGAMPMFSAPAALPMLPTPTEFSMFPTPEMPMIPAQQQAQSLRVEFTTQTSTN